MPRVPSTATPIELLAEALAEVRSLCPDVPVLAIHWMHVKHPLHPVQEGLLANDPVVQTGAGGSAARTVSGLRWAAALPVQVGRCLLYAIYLTLRLGQLRWHFRREIAELKSQAFDVVAKTWRFGSDRAADGADFYYGDLQRRLERRGVRMLLLCGDARGRGWRTFAAANVSCEPPRQLPELCLVSLSAPFRMVWQQIVTSFRLRRIIARVRHPLAQRVAALASRDCLSRHITPFGFYDWIGRASVLIWRPRAFMTLYEGHGWEQCAWRGAKTADTACRTVGYQHTILLPHNLALLRPQPADLTHARPDVVLCLGPRTRAMLLPSHAQSDLVTFGTFRRSSESNVPCGPRPQLRAVVVLPEGYLKEENLLFNTAIRIARRLPEYRFIFRCHPVSSFGRIRPLLDEDPLRVPNIELSSGRTIADDFARSSVVLYRGSSSVLYAVVHGLKPVYLHDERYHEVDPLFELKNWRERACSIEQLQEVLRDYGDSDGNRDAESWRQAVEYVDGYTTPVDEASVDRFLARVGLKAGTGT